RIRRQVRFPGRVTGLTLACSWPAVARPGHDGDFSSSRLFPGFGKPGNCTQESPSCEMVCAGSLRSSSKYGLCILYLLGMVVKLCTFLPGIPGYLKFSTGQFGQTVLQFAPVTAAVYW